MDLILNNMIWLLIFKGFKHRNLVTTKSVQSFWFTIELKNWDSLSVSLKLPSFSRAKQKKMLNFQALTLFEAKTLLFNNLQSANMPYMFYKLKIVA